MVTLARRLLKLPILHYVDDYFGAERAGCAEVAMQTFSRLVRACLGASAVAASKLDFGRSIIILGVEMLMQKDGVQFWPAPDKVAKWLAKKLPEKRLGHFST